MVVSSEIRLSRGLPACWVELLLVGTCYVLYQAVQIFVTGSEKSAIDRPEWIWSVQTFLHINPEIYINQWVAGNELLTYFTGYFYGIAHFAVTHRTCVNGKSVCRNVESGLCKTRESIFLRLIKCYESVQLRYEVESFSSEFHACNLRNHPRTVLGIR